MSRIFGGADAAFSPESFNTESSWTGSKKSTKTCCQTDSSSSQIISCKVNDKVSIIMSINQLTTQHWYISMNARKHHNKQFPRKLSYLVAFRPLPLVISPFILKEPSYLHVQKCEKLTLIYIISNSPSRKKAKSSPTYHTI